MYRLRSAVHTLMPYIHYIHTLHTYKHDNISVLLSHFTLLPSTLTPSTDGSGTESAGSTRYR